jgi:hypothetical protein
VAAALVWLSAAVGAARADERAIALAPGTRVAAPISFRQLTIFPVVQTSDAGDNARYLTLSDGLKRKLVRISELPSGGEVNRLLVDNLSDQPLLILGGEVVLGGQQDRILGQDTIVPAKKRLAVQVFCVEHGRWSGSRQFTAAEGMADSKIRIRAKYRADQSQVWNEVAAKNAAHGAAPATGTYRNLAAGAEGERAIGAYRAAIGGALDKRPYHDKVVGAISAVNGRISGVELFAKPELFASYRDKLLDSIYMSAADAPLPAAPAPPPKPEEIGAFMLKANRARSHKVNETAAGLSVEQRGDGVLKSKLQPSADKPPVYESYQAEE